MRTLSVGTQGRGMAAALTLAEAVVPVLLLIAAFAVRAWAAAPIDFPVTEPSAYYWGVARNLVEGRGLVSDALWTYPAGVPTFPRPAFEMWLPLPALLAALPMALLGTSYESAQLSSVVLGALVAPLAWLLGRGAALARGLSRGRVAMVALGSGLAGAVLPPLLVADVAPESTTPFTVLALTIALLMPTTRETTRPRRATVARITVGLLLGLAYLCRNEAIYLGLAYLIFTLADGRWPLSARLSQLLPTVVAGALTVLPWLVRDLLVLGTPIPGGTLELALMTRNEQLFASAERPTLRAFVDAGLMGMVLRQVAALGRNLADVILFPMGPMGAIGILTLLAAIIGRVPRLFSSSPLKVLVLVGLTIYLVSSLVFPVASAWGTFRHAAGPLLVGLSVVAVLGLDAFVAAVGHRRGWQRSNAWLAPLAALVLTVPLALLQVWLFNAQGTALEDRYGRLAAALETLPQLDDAPRAGDAPGTQAAVMSDHPIWLAEAIRRPVAALPDESPTQVWRLARRLDVPLLVVIDRRGRYPAIIDIRRGECFRPVSGSADRFAGARVVTFDPRSCPPEAPR